jgi:DNA polymerase-3 subunit epsilon
MSCLAVIDFETTGATPAQGARATEVAICLLEGGRIVDRFSSLMNTGVHIPPFITQLTGITNAMVAEAPPAEAVMREAATFVGARTMVAHNAAFDRQFWRSELAHCGQEAGHDFACTLLLSRRLYPDAPNHKLGTLAQWFDLPVSGRAHRALADAEVAAHLLARMQHDLQTRHGLGQADAALLMALQRTAKQQVGTFLRQQISPGPGQSPPPDKPGGSAG